MGLLDLRYAGLVDLTCVGLIVAQSSSSVGCPVFCKRLTDHVVQRVLLLKRVLLFGFLLF